MLLPCQKSHVLTDGEDDADQQPGSGLRMPDVASARETHYRCRQKDNCERAENIFGRHPGARALPRHLASFSGISRAGITCGRWPAAHHHGETRRRVQAPDRSAPRQAGDAIIAETAAEDLHPNEGGDDPGQRRTRTLEPDQGRHETATAVVDDVFPNLMAEVVQAGHGHDQISTAVVDAISPDGIPTIVLNGERRPREASSLVQFSSAASASDALLGRTVLVVCNPSTPPIIVGVVAQRLWNAKSAESPSRSAGEAAGRRARVGSTRQAAHRSRGVRRDSSDLRQEFPGDAAGWHASSCVASGS